MTLEKDPEKDKQKYSCGEKNQKEILLSVDRPLNRNGLTVGDSGRLLHTFIVLFFITYLHLSCNKSAKFHVLNVYFAEDNHGEKEDKIK